MHPMKKSARVAGLLYLLVVLAGPFVLIYAPGRLFVHGDASATVSNILAHQSLFQAYIVVGLVSELLFIAVVLALYRLLKGVNLQLATVMVILILIDAPLAFLSIANEVATLTFVRGADFLSVFDKPQRDALATLLINFDRQGVLVSELFWGLWLLPLGLAHCLYYRLPGVLVPPYPAYQAELASKTRSRHQPQAADFGALRLEHRPILGKTNRDDSDLFQPNHPLIDNHGPFAALSPNVGQPPRCCPVGIGDVAAHFTDSRRLDLRHWLGLPGEGQRRRRGPQRGLAATLEPR